MHRSLQPRLLGLSLSVASFAVSATILLLAYDGDDDAGGQPLLETDLDAYTDLYFFANEHASWDGVASLVLELAERTGERIAVTTPDGAVIADSAELLGTEAGDLPSTPTTLIDAAAEPLADAEPEPNVVVGGGSDGGANLSFYTWQPTEQERQQLQARADAAAACAENARPAEPPAEPWYRRLRTDASGTPTTTTSGTPPETVRSCGAEALFAPTAASRALRERTVAETAACLDANALPYEATTDGDGLPRLLPVAGTGPTWAACAEAAATEAKRAFVAPPAHLYVGSGDGFDPLSEAGSPRVATAAATGLAAAVALTLPVGRRLTRRLRALTVAAVESHERRRTAMISEVTHELRTPLSNVRTHLEAARDGVVPLAPGLVTSLITESAQLERLVTDLHDLALADAGLLRLHPEERDAADLAEQVVAGHRAEASALGVHLRVQDAERVTVRADPARLRQVLGNLVSNAVRHTPAGGTVTITVRRSAGSAVLTVSDTGCGIAAEDLPHVFDRAYRSDPPTGRPHPGSGLGLAIAQHLVEAHQGRLEVSSAVGVGSAFTVVLPAVESHLLDQRVRPS
ncbi:sensor histidine kinase [Jiangella asiatica]|uniref:histidine kinase n=1 Tax=Jiangella asiatica TaxID=2530372 RepID=A0A4R5D6B7_9ACTN|nr:HAMP domain-containing sensor histidine kinase [Jiangella asiatica]TDE08117.1 HAMP domain-containing histidine kinase [Jiangella asiatica]